MADIHASARVLIVLGVIFLAGLTTDAIGKQTRLPRVTLLLLFGFAVGPGGFNLIGDASVTWFGLIAGMALALVGFLLGKKFTVRALRAHGRPVLVLSAAVTLATLLVVAGGMMAIGAPAALALLFGAVATATDPAATMDVIAENRARGRFTDILSGIVAVDDAWGLIIFSLTLAAMPLLNGSGNIIEPLLTALWELGGALTVGVVLGVPMAYLTNHVRPGQPTLLEALGMIFLCGGVALYLEVSFLLSAMVMGAVVANLARHHERPFHAIEEIEWPFLMLFFVLAGASLAVDTLLYIGLLGIAYLFLRTIGRLTGSYIGGWICHAPGGERRWFGLALLPQAGVALGMALVAAEQFPTASEWLLPIVVGTTVIFEFIGPIMTRQALIRTDSTR